MSVLVDTCILIDVFRSRTESQRSTGSRLRELLAGSDEVYVSTVTVAELFAGAKTDEVTRLNALIDALDVVGLDLPTAELAGGFLARFHRSRGVELGDAVIAASAVRLPALLWTDNRKHFPMEGLRFFDPAATGAPAEK